MVTLSQHHSLFTSEKAPTDEQHVDEFLKGLTLLPSGPFAPERARGSQFTQEEDAGLHFPSVTTSTVPSCEMRNCLWVAEISFEAPVAHLLLNSVEKQRKGD